MCRQTLFPLAVALLFPLISCSVAGCKDHAGSMPRAASTASVPLPAAQPGTPAKKVFPSPMAGSWYEADPNRLAAEIDGDLRNAKEQPLPGVCALILPHAGLRWSGGTAAYGIKQVQGRTFSRVIILGPTHRIQMKNTASLPDATDYATPLGETPIDVDLVRELEKCPAFRVVPEANENEHSVQVMLPFLQRALGEFRFVPIVLGQLDAASVRVIADAVLRAIDEDTLVVASTDFTHYGPDFSYVPFKDKIPENIRELDMGAYQFIENRDLEGFTAYVQRTGATICGRSAIEVLLAMLPPDTRAHLLHYDTSGAMTGDDSNSVSYVSAAFTGRWKPPLKGRRPSPGDPLSREDKERLLALARGALKFFIEHGKAPAPEQLGVGITPGMKQVMGAFVTLKEHGELRGCIGEIYPVRPLYEAVLAHAIDAGVNDPRFPPVGSGEFNQLSFEISALTPPRPVPSYRDIVLGRDGIVLQKSGRSAVFLPQVAPEQGWGLEETLTHLCRKAGLAGDAWKEGAGFTVFEAIVFDEEAP
jgi:MEMO1 family protein